VNSTSATTATCLAADAVVRKAVAPVVARCGEAVVAQQQGSAIAAFRAEALQAGSAVADARASATTKEASDQVSTERQHRSMARAAIRRALHAPTMAMRRGESLKHRDVIEAVEVAVTDALNRGPKTTTKHKFRISKQPFGGSPALKSHNQNSNGPFRLSPCQEPKELTYEISVSKDGNSQSESKYVCHL